MDNPAPTNVPIHDLIRRRWSPRAFADRSVATADLVGLLEAARWAPSSSNEQPWRFLIARREETETFARLLACLVPGNQRWAASAPVLMLTATRLAFVRHEKPNRHAMHDAGLALENLLIEATARGLVAHPMAGFDADAARLAFAIPEAFDPVAAVAIGYMGDPELLPDDLRAREIAPRTRRPLGESVFGSTWGEGVAWLEGAVRNTAAPSGSS
jgi:nitroreductase